MAAPAPQTPTTLAGAFRATSATINVPSGVASGDVIVLVVYREDLADTVASSGFTSKSVAAADDHRMHILWKRASGSDAGTYTITFGGNDWTEAAAHRITGCIASGDPWDFVTTAFASTNGTASPAVGGSSSTTVADTLLFYAASNTAGGAWTPPSGMTERTDIGEDLTTATVAQASAGATGAKSATCAGSGHRTAFLGALMPVPSGTTVTGTIAESWAFTAPATGLRTVLGTIAESIGFTAPVTGGRTVLGQATGPFGFSAPASVDADTVSGTIAETWTFTAPATGTRTVLGQATGSFGFDAPAAGKRTTFGAGTGLFGFSAPASQAGLPDIDPTRPWIVRARPGYDITDDPNGAGWEDISDLVVGAVTLRVGRERPGDQSRACELKFTANCDDGLLMPNLVASDWWPNVDLGLPLQFWRGDSTGAPVLRCTVAIDEINPVWPDGLDGHCEVDVVASGYLRWMDQGQQVAATASTITTVSESPLAAWPLDDQDGATAGASSVPGVAPMVRTTSAVRFGQVSGPSGTTRYPSVEVSGRLSGVVPVTSVTDRWSVQCIGLAERESGTDWWTLMYWTTTSTSAPAWRLRWDGPDSGSTTLRWIDGDGTEHVVITVATSPINAWQRMAVYCVQSGGNVSCTLYIDGAVAGTGTATGVTTGRVTTITVGDWDGPGTGMISVGDVSVWDKQLDASGQYQSQTGYDGEPAHLRWLRLLTEAGLLATTDAVSSILMGPQKAGTLIDAVRACEDSDGGMMYDQPDRGLVYVATSQMYNQEPAIELDARTQQHLVTPFAATRSDLLAATDVTITREGGGSRRRVVPSRRTYTDSDTLSLHTDDLASAVASWRAHHGAQTVLRYPQISWDVDSVPGLLDASLALRPAQLIRVTGLPHPHPDEAIDLIVQGWTETHFTATCRFDVKVGPARLFEIMTIGSDDSDDWDDTTARIDSDTSTIGGSGGTTSSGSLVVVSDYGWSRTAVPYDWDLLGERVRVTAMSAYSGGQQTATVTRAINGISKAIPVDTPVRLWRPPVIGL